MEKGVIQSDSRHTTRSIRKAMQGNVIRALVELITNADDSYYSGPGCLDHFLCRF